MLVIPALSWISADAAEPPVPCPETCPDLGAMQCLCSRGITTGQGWGALQWQDVSSNWNKVQRPHLELRFRDLDFIGVSA